MISMGSDGLNIMLYYIVYVIMYQDINLLFVQDL